MSEKSSIKCELIFDEGLHRVNFDGSLQELRVHGRPDYQHIKKRIHGCGFTDEQAKGFVVGGIEKFWGDPERRRKE